MSRFGRPEAILSAARELLNGKLPSRSVFVDSHAVEDPPEWNGATRARVPPGAMPLILELAEDAPETPAIEVEELELFQAETQLVRLVFCGHCRRRHTELAAGPHASPYFKCPRCRSVNEVER